MEMNPTSVRDTARLAGVVYLVWILSGLFALMYMPSQIDTQGDAAATAHNILSNELLFRISIVNDLVSSALWVFLVLTLYRLFRSVNERQARLLVAMVVVQIPPVFVIDALQMTSLMILKGEVLSTFELTQRQDVAVLFLRIQDYVTMTLVLFWGLWLFPLAILVYRSRFLPQFLGVWLGVNGFALVVLGLTGLLLPQYKDLVYKIAVPAMFGEFALMLWLLIRGAKQEVVTRAPAQ